MFQNSIPGLDGHGINLGTMDKMHDLDIDGLEKARNPLHACCSGRSRDTQGALSMRSAPSAVAAFAE